mmetsp:Transcript_13207/g.26671  ORF Transcript_13207/g.26671 Transcript_13207/m.26671 type:complete len:454 (+) Transcript_13207:137-1498(+)
MAAGVMLLPGWLFWAPEVEQPQVAADFQVLQALDLCRHAGGKAAVYSVTHYATNAVGAAFGPLGLASLLHFCRGLDVALARNAVALTTPKGDRATRFNVLVMMGAYLIMRQGWSTEKLASTIGGDAGSKFICSWSTLKTPEPERVMSVRDVWDGLEIAIRRSWLQSGFLDGDEKLELAVSRYHLRAICFDATWIIPGLLMVASDPTTVIYDPNPATCKRIAPQADAAGADVVPPAPTEAPPNADDLDWGLTPTNKSRGSVASLASVDTVCKEYNENYEDMLPSDSSLVPKDYASFLVQSGIGIVVRANFSKEEGMPTPSYGQGTFEPFGIEQIDIPVVDTHGGLPKPADVARMLQACDAFLDPTAGERPGVFVHCKGGFGRSMVFASCLAIYRFDLPGSALLGWMRVARPGAFTTPKQELFLKSMRGAADVMKYAEMDSGSGACASCKGCSLQ